MPLRWVCCAGAGEYLFAGADAGGVVSVWAGAGPYGLTFSGCTRAGTPPEVDRIISGEGANPGLGPAAETWGGAG